MCKWQIRYQSICGKRQPIRKTVSVNAVMAKIHIVSSRLSSSSEDDRTPVSLTTVA